MGGTLRQFLGNSGISGMGKGGDPHLTTIVKQTRRTLEALGRLYAECSAACAQEIPHLLEEGPRQFAATLAQYEVLLVIKVAVELMRADFEWSPAERELAAEVVEHVWKRRLTGERLVRGWEELVEKVDGVGLEPLLRPFARLAPLQRRAADLESLVLRLANLIAKADGRLEPAEVQRLRHLQDELERHLERPLAVVAEAPAGAILSPQLPQEAEPPSGAGRGSESARGSSHRSPLPLPGQPPPAADPAARLKAALEDLHALVGLGAIKREVEELANFLQVQQARAHLGLPQTPVALHTVFRGNPGTGKTTVARILGRILGALGVVAKGHVVETDRSGLVAEFAGQTGPKTHRQIDQALDGILFIDEAYSLIAAGGDDPYGHEAVQVLLKRMEDDRQRLVVILAGYSGPMDDLLAANPGLSSRFQRQFTFPDYSPGEMLEIMRRFCAADRYHFPAEVRAKFLVACDYLARNKNEHFGNARLVRNLFEAAIRRQANRLAPLAPLTEEALTTLVPDDLVLPDVPDEVWAGRDLAALALSVICPGCQRVRPLPAGHLGRRVQCPGCHHRFRADGGELAPPAS